MSFCLHAFVSWLNERKQKTLGAFKQTKNPQSCSSRYVMWTCDCTCEASCLFVFSNLRSSFTFPPYFRTLAFLVLRGIPARYSCSAGLREWDSRSEQRACGKCARECLTASGLLPWPFIPGYF